MEHTHWLFIVGIVFGVFLDFCEGKRCYSSTRGSYHYCDSSESCCSDNDYPCCSNSELTTGAIIGLVIGIIIFIIIIALVVYLVYRANKRKRSVVTTTTMVGQPTIQTFQTTTYTQNQYGTTTYPRGQVYPPNYPQDNPAYPPPPPTYM